MLNGLRPGSTTTSMALNGVLGKGFRIRIRDWGLVIPWLLAFSDLVVLASLLLVFESGWNNPAGWVSEAGIMACFVLPLYYIAGLNHADRLISRTDYAGLLGMGVVAPILALLTRPLWGDGPVLSWGVAGLIAINVIWLGVSRKVAQLTALGLDARTPLVFIGNEADAIRFRSWLREHRPRRRMLRIILTGRDRDHETLSRILEGPVQGLVLGTHWRSLPHRMMACLINARLQGIPIWNPGELYQAILQRTPVEHDEPGWFFDDCHLHLASRRIYFFLKRTFDLVAALSLLIGLSWLMAATALAVKVTSPGPVWYRQRRMGLGGRIFTIYKFRTMRTNAEAGGPQWASTNDPRITWIGRFLRRTRIDELPQLWNILRNDMSLIGPRPERPEFTRKLADQIPYYHIRHLVKPGITGWAQVCYRYGASVGDARVKLEYDLYYLQHASVFLDLRIALHTVGVVFGLKGR